MSGFRWKTAQAELEKGSIVRPWAEVGGATPVADAVVQERRADMAVSRARERVAEAARSGAAAHDNMEDTLTAVAEAEAVVEEARAELRRRRGDGELDAAEARLGESRDTAAALRRQGPGLEAAIAAADETAAVAQELSTEVRRGYDEYAGHGQMDGARHVVKRD